MLAPPVSNVLLQIQLLLLFIIVKSMHLLLADLKVVGVLRGPIEYRSDDVTKIYFWNLKIFTM